MVTPKVRPNEITRLLEAWSMGEPDALGRLMPLVVEDLHRMARTFFRGEVANHTLQPTALISEVYLRLEGEKKLVWQNRRQFFAFASTLMRHILVDHARGRRALKRGHAVAHLPLEAASVIAVDPNLDLVALNQALDRLEKIDPRQCEIVTLRFFTGLDVKEVAEVLALSTSTVKREWRAARYWLDAQLTASDPPSAAQAPA
jgi:RNA polymerase sigma factor (TIGR02999 family)